MAHSAPPAVPRSTLSLAEATAVTCICFGLPILWSLNAVLSGFPDARFSDAGNAWMIGLEITLAAVALVYLQHRGFDIASLYPLPTVRHSLLGIGLFIACLLVGALATSLLPAARQHQMIGFSAAGVSMVSIVLLAMVNGTFEEVFLLGVLTRGLRGFGLSLAMGLPMLARVLYHLYQGPLGVIWVAAFGVTLTLAYVVTRQLWPSVLAHILWDIVPLV
jgi:membrane protease YdiL (CAAX protease family)